MTTLFLDAMFGRPTGPARQWLAGLSREPRIAWYPSAGEDFRDLLYLSEEYARCFPSGQAEPAPPDLFLHTDFSSRWSRFLDTAVVHQDERTTIRVEAIEELPRCDLPLDARIVEFPEWRVATGRVLFLLLRVTSARLAMDRVVPVLYASCENAAFCAERLLPLGARCSHVVRIRYGGGFGGGGRSSGHWILRNLDRLHCELLVWDQHDHEQDGDRRCLERFPNLDGPLAQPDRFRRLRTLPEAMWSGHGDVAWELVEPVSG